ncbi:MAG: glycosyltransferase [Proteobacteria bacterium]|nr:glycosyltransferase [Pseudomonadota bacterium]
MSRGNEKRRVALFRNVFLHYSETFIHDELRHHIRYDATIMARQHMNAEIFPGHKVVAIETIPDRRRHLASLWYGVSTHSPLLDSAMAGEKLDIVHAHFAHNGVYAMGFARRHGLPLVVSLHGRDVTILLGMDKYKPQWWHYLVRYRRLFKEAALFLAASTELKELIVKVGCPEEKVVVHRLGVDLTSFKPDPSKREIAPPLVVMVGRFVEKKGHIYGIEASARAIEAGYPHRLVIVGDGPLEGQYRRLIEARGLSQVVEMPGPMPHKEVVALLNRASVLVAPSVVAKNLDRESGLIVVKEASACGVPAIGTLHGGIPDIIDDGKTGYLVEERNSDTLGERLITLLSDEELRQKMGRAAMKKMVNEYDIRERVRILEEIYDSVIERQNSGGTLT